jgi:hypothetical protein
MGYKPNLKKIQDNEIKLLYQVIHVEIGFNVRGKTKSKSSYYVKKCKH